MLRAYQEALGAYEQAQIAYAEADPDCVDLATYRLLAAAAHVRVCRARLGLSIEAARLPWVRTEERAVKHQYRESCGT